MTHGEFTHVDIPSDDMERAQQFYEELFGWTFQEVPDFDDFMMAQPGDGQISGALSKRGTMAPQGSRLYIEVDSIDDALVKATSLGGAIVVEKTAVPSMGWYAAINDSEGTEIGIWENTAG
jgi:predicted enzyme related to lactoylglutathione lyase